MTTHYLDTPLTDDAIRQLQAGDEVFLSGVIYMARDAAHKRFIDTLARGEPLPVDLTGHVVFYGGSARQARPRHRRGGADLGLPHGPIRHGPVRPRGQGGHRQAATAARPSANRAAGNVAVCFSAIGGISATLFSCIQSATLVCYEDLRPKPCGGWRSRISRCW